MLPQLEYPLLLRAQAGDADAFEQLQERLTPPVRRFVRRLVGDSPAEDDIVQNTMIAFYFNLPRIRPVEKLRPYLFRIARNCCYDELRRKKWTETVSLDGDDEEAHTWLAYDDSPDPSTQPEELTHWILLYAQVRAAIDRLPELQRETLILYMEEALTYTEIAVAMNTNIGTVKSRLFHAKLTLQRLLPVETLQALKLELGEGKHNA